MDKKECATHRYPKHIPTHITARISIVFFLSFKIPFLLRSYFKERQRKAGPFPLFPFHQRNSRGGSGCNGKYTAGPRQPRGRTSPEISREKPFHGPLHPHVYGGRPPAGEDRKRVQSATLRPTPTIFISASRPPPMESRSFPSTRPSFFRATRWAASIRYRARSHIAKGRAPPGERGQLFRPGEAESPPRQIPPKFSQKRATMPFIRGNIVILRENEAAEGLPGSWFSIRIPGVLGGCLLKSRIKAEISLRMAS